MTSEDTKNGDKDPSPGPARDNLELDLCKHITALQHDFDSIESSGAWSRVYLKVREDAGVQERQLKLTTEASRTHIRRNRYRDVLPYDQCRVRLMGASIDQDYINASLVPVEQANRKYILSQGPLPNTSAHFWQMIWEQGCLAVIMLNKIVEKQSVKCHQYFPVDPDETQVFGQYELTLLSCEEKPNYCIRKLRLHRQASEDDSGSPVEQPERVITHFQYTHWPDFGVPSKADDFLQFLLEVRRTGLLNCDRYGPPVVHCSAGIGRSGSFVMIDSLLNMSHPTPVVSSPIDVLKFVVQLRKYRMGLIQTHDQLRFSWFATLTALQDQQKWGELLSLRCVGLETPTLDRRPSVVKRVNANQKLDETRFVSVDNSDLAPPGASKRAKIQREDSPAARVTHSASDLSMHATNGEVSTDAARAVLIRQRRATERADVLKNRIAETHAKMLQHDNTFWYSGLLTAAQQHSYFVAAVGVAGLATICYFAFVAE